MRKLTLSVLAMVLTAGFAFGQLTKSDKADPDESKVPNSRMDQHEAFLDGEYQFPAKPRNMWAVGIEGGYGQVSGDVNPDFGWNAGINFRKALGYALSVRFGVNYMKYEGDDFDNSSDGGSKSRIGPQKASLTNRLNGALAYQEYGFYDHQYEMEGFMPYAEFVLNLNNINFHREQNRWNFNVSGGPAAVLFDTDITLNNITGGNSPTGPAIANQRHDWGNSDDTREDAEIGDFDLIPAATFAASVSYRAGDRLSITAQPRYTRTWDDWIDGEAYDDTGVDFGDIQYSPDKDQLFSTNLLLEFALGSADKKVQPLWWENPLKFPYDYLIDEYSLDIDTCYLEDSDGDGVSDCFDKEPNSPCAFVDGAGVVIDSDKDGIADCVDACPFTPRDSIDAIDENGCAPDMPPPNYCELIKDCACCDKPPVVNNPIPVDRCAGMTYPSVKFAAGSRRVLASENAKIQTMAAQLGANPECRIVVEGFGKGKQGIQRAWARAKAVTDALVSNYGIDRSRIITRYSGVDGYGDVVIVRSARAGEMGSSNPAPPAPGTY